MAEIHLTRCGMVTLVDDADLPLVSGLKWRAHRRRKDRGWYARAEVPRSGGKFIYMHRLLIPDVPMVDHKNGDGLDNRRSTNLRPATQSQNNANQAKTRGASRYKGVTWFDRTKRWRAQIKGYGVRRHLGYFVDEEAAALAYNEAAREIFGSFARLNRIEAVTR